jgi:hypothetical protein
VDSASWVCTILWGCCPIFGLLIGAQRGRAAFGAIMGLFLGPIGCLITAAMGSTYRCPRCKGTIQKGAQLCPHCRSVLG